MQIERVKYVIWAADLTRALKFYSELGAEIGKEGPAGCEITLAGATLFIHSGGEGKRTWTGLSFVIPDVYEGAELVKNAGGLLLKELEDTEEEKAHLAFCADTEGNEFMLSQRRS